ncbi:MAG: 50S ribosomal protein L4 [Planctomycetota bacterium]|nr:MAG: 50S ribosomal protein L4 [Planctomycetota bacterium]
MSLELKTCDATGKAVGSVTVDEAALGGKVKNRLLHAAAVMYHNNLRQGSHCTKSRSEIAGSTKKLYRQKGTGRARMGNRKSGIRRGGGVIHGPKPRNYVYHMPRKQRQAALRSALLGKAKDDELRLVSGLDFSEPKTKHMAALLGALGLEDTVLVATDGLKRNVHLAGRNMPGVTVLPAQEVNARHVLTHKFLVMDQAAFERIASKAERVKGQGTKKEEG